MPAVFQAVAENAADDPDKRPLLRRAKTIAMISGSGTIPGDVLTKCFSDATFLDPADLSKSYSWEADYYDFINAPSGLLGYFSSSIENIIVQREPGEDYDLSTGFTGDIQLTVPCVPVTPATAGDQVAAADVIISDIISVGAEMLRGAIATEAARKAATAAAGVPAAMGRLINSGFNVSGGALQGFQRANVEEKMAAGISQVAKNTGRLVDIAEDDEGERFQ